MIPTTVNINTTQLNNKNMRSPLLNGNNNAYIDNPILKKSSLTD